MSQTCCGISLTEPSRQGTRFLQTGIPRRNEIRSGRYREEKFVQGPSLAGFNSYEEAVRTFSLPVPEFYNFASDTIDYWARQEEVSDVRKGLPGFWWVSDQGHEVKWTYKDLSEHSKRVANMLSGPCGLKPSDRLMVILPKVPQWWILNIASIRAGTVFITGTTQLTAKDIKYRFGRSNAKCIITDAENAEKVDEIIGNCPSVETKVIVGDKRTGWMSFEDLFFSSSSDYKTVQTRSSDPMMIFFTSGTTGHPKMAEHSHASYGLGHKITATYGLDMVPTDISWNLADTGWAKSAWASVFAPWLNGSCVFTSNITKFDPEYVLQLCEKYPISTLCAPPTGFRFMVKERLNKYRFKTLRHCTAGGEPLNPEVREKWYDATKNVIHELYGQTETVLSCASPKCLPVRIGSMGKAVPGMDLAIVDETGKEVGPNVLGEIALRVKPNRPVGLFLRYVDEPEKTAAAYRGDFFVTGDQGRIDEDGYIWFSSRADDVIISAGYRIGPHEVENALLSHPAVVESAVVSSPDEMRGEVVKAFVVLHSGYEVSDRGQLITALQNHVKETTAPYKYPRKIEFVESLPKTISGKVRRVELRKREWKK